VPITTPDLKESATIHSNLISKDSSVDIDVYFVHQLLQNGNITEGKNLKVGGFTQPANSLPTSTLVEGAHSAIGFHWGRLSAH